jgi:cell division protein FtsW
MTTLVKSPPKKSGNSKPSATKRATRAKQTGPSGTFVLLFAVLVVLNLIGLVMVLSASSVVALHTEGSSYYYFERQLMWLAIGIPVFIFALKFDYRRWRPLALPILLATCALLVVVLVPGLGKNVNGSSRWIGFGSFGIQPSEFAKLGVLLFVSDLLARRNKWINDTRLTLRPVLAVFVVVALLIMLQPNLGTTIVVASITFTLLFVAGTPLAPLSGWGALGVMGAVSLSMVSSYRRARVLAFLHPWNDPLNTGYQTIQSQLSLASGGLFGVGLGASRAKWGYLPEAHTDFIFSIIGEELGLVGMVVVLGLFVAFGVLGAKIAVDTDDCFGRLLAVGITTWICVQAFVNIGAAVGVLPITGVPLPFVSFGGSSLLAGMAACGMLLNVAKNGSASASPARARLSRA